MRRVIRILSEDIASIPASLPEELKASLKADDFELLRSDLSDPEVHAPAQPGGWLDLLYVPTGQSLNWMLAFRLAALPGGGELGVYVDGLAPVIMQGGRPVFRRFLADRGARHDIPVYEAAGDTRQVWEAERRDVPLPNQVYLGLTQICNRSCSFCVSRTFEPAMLSLDTVRQLAQQLRGHVDVIALTGAGEAMVHPDFWRAVEILIEEIPGIQFKMNSSGVSLGKSAERIVRYPFRNITISLNAATAETYQRFIGGNFEQVLSSIKKMVAVRARSESGADLSLTLSMVLMNSTVHELPDFVSRAFELGVEEVQGIYLMVNDSELEAESPWHRPQRSNAFLARASERASSLGVAMRLPPRFQEDRSVSSSFQSSSLPETQGQACVEPWSTIYLRPNGEILPCPYSEESLGNLHHANLVEIWNGAPYKALRESLADKKYRTMCQHCCGFNETGRVDDYVSHWLGERRPRHSKSRSLPVLNG